jgi:hypothetical protein
MIEILQFVFQSFWTWLGTFLIVGSFRLFTIRVEHKEKKKI